MNAKKQPTSYLSAVPTLCRSHLEMSTVLFLLQTIPCLGMHLRSPTPT